jgi:hypothetical protein
MARLFSNRERPFDLGVLPSELLARAPGAAIVDARMPADARQAAAQSILESLPEYRTLCETHLDGAPAAARAPLPDDLLARARNLKASAYFLDATLAGACRIEPSDWAAAEHPAHTHAFVFLLEFSRETQPGEAGDEWMRGAAAMMGADLAGGPFRELPPNCLRLASICRRSSSCSWLVASRALNAF